MPLVFPTPEEMAAWPAPNYVDPVTRRPLLLGIEIPLFILVVLFNAMRLYRTAIVKAMGVDDYFMIAATICFCANSISMCVSTIPRIATGYHIWDVPQELVVDSGITGSIAMATQLMFVPITAFTKVSVLCTYLRIFPSDQNKYFCYSMLAFTAAWAVTAFFMALFQCSPIQAYWLPFQYPEAKCMDTTILFYTTGFMNVASDFLIFLWPVKDLAKIQISVKQRVTLITMFSLGIVICIAGVCRLWYTSVYVKSYDILWHGATLYAIVSIETSVGIICGCLPACRPLMSKLLPRVFNSTHESSTHGRKTKKSSRVDGQSFPFQSLGGGIVKSASYSVSYEEAGQGSKSASETRASTVKSKLSRADPDNVSEGSEEWIIEPQLASTRTKSPV